jgi:hypothetical protein
MVSPSVNPPVLYSWSNSSSTRENFPPLSLHFQKLNALSLSPKLLIRISCPPLVGLKLVSLASLFARVVHTLTHCHEPTTRPRHSPARLPQTVWILPGRLLLRRGQEKPKALPKLHWKPPSSTARERQTKERLIQQYRPRRKAPW